MIFYTEDNVAEDRVRVGLRDDEDGDVTVVLNGVPHVSFSRDGDLVLYDVAKEDEVLGVQYENNHIKLYKED